MCDPLSVTASVLAVAGFAVKSCECLYKTLRLLSETPDDLRHHIIAIQALQSTFGGIVALGNDAQNAEIITTDLKDRLQACMLDLQAMERRARSFHAQIGEGKARRTWSKVRGSLKHQRQTLKSHLRRIESYHMRFSLEMLLINMRLGLRPPVEDRQIREKYCPASEVSVDLKVRPSQPSPLLQNHQEHFSERVSLRSCVSRYLENDLFRFLLWLGPITMQQWHSSQSLASEVLKSGGGYGIALAAASDLYLPFRLELTVFLISNRKGPSASTSLHWNMFWPRMISSAANIVNLALCGDVDAMKGQFSKRNATAFDVFPDGSTLLHLAASKGHVDMVKFLLQEGARVNAMNDFGETPLHSAIALSKNYDVPRVLLENGGDLHNRNADGKTPLHTFPSQVSEQILRCQQSLLDFSARDHRGMSLLHYLAWSSKTTSSTFKRYHKHSNFDIKAIDMEGRSMLHLAAQRGNVPVIEYIICAAEDFDINHKDCRGRTALHYGVENRRACDTITALVSHGADIWARDCHGRSALHHATNLGNLPAVEALSAFGMADALRITDCPGLTADTNSSFGESLSASPAQTRHDTMLFQ